MTNTETKKTVDVGTLVGLGMLTALVVVLQFIPMNLRFSAFSITLTLIPIVVGAALYTWKAGLWLGLVFGVTVLLTGDANAFLAINAVGTVITVLAKGGCSGLCAGLVYELAAKKNQILAVILAGITAPVVNTGVFLIGTAVFFMDYVKSLAGDMNIVAFMLVGFVGINFVIELGINLVLNPAILQIIRVSKKIIEKNKGR